MVYAVLGAMLIVIAIDILMFKGARTTGPIEWGKMPPRSQYALFLLAITFTWTMGLMGYARSGIREYWHVYGILRDKAPDAFTPHARVRGEHRLRDDAPVPRPRRLDRGARDPSGKVRQVPLT